MDPLPQPGSVTAAQQQLMAMAAAAQERARQQRQAEAAAAQQRGSTNTLGTVAAIRGMDAITGATAAAPAVAGAGSAVAAGAYPGAEAVGTLGDVGSGMLDSVAAAPSTVAPYASQGAAAQAGAIPSAGGATSAIPGIAGAAGMYDILHNKKHGKSGAIEGGVSGAGIGYSIGGPMGAAIGAPIGAGIGYFGNFGDKDAYKTEGNRLKALKDKGINVPDSLMGPTQLTAGRKPEQLVDPTQPKDFVGWDPKGNWINNKYALSRDYKDLFPQDVWGYSAFMDRFGNDYLQKLSEDQRYSIAKKSLETGAATLHHGTLDLATDNKDFNDYSQGIINGTIKPEHLERPQQGQVGSPGAMPDYAAAQARMDQVLNAAISSANASAAAGQAAAHKANLVGIAMQPPNVPKINSSGPVTTGVQNLDNILRSVL